MSINLNFTRSECIHTISEAETEQIVRACIEHFALPIIFGADLGLLSQQSFEQMGGIGKKPEPLSIEAKLDIYNRIKTFMKTKIINETTILVISVLNKSLENLSDEELHFKAVALSTKVADPEPNWNKLSNLFEDHTCLFKDLQKSTHLKANLISFHDILCPIMCKYRDSGELFDNIDL